jgi:hypothetical protein
VERSVGQAGARERLDGCRDEPVREAAIPDQRQWDERLPEPDAWDAWDDARQDEAANAERPPRALADAGAGKSVAPAQDVRAKDARFPQEHPLGRRARPAAAGLCTPGAVRSAARSCAGPAWEAQQPRAAQPDLTRRVEVVQPWSAAPVAEPPLLVVAPPAARPLPAEQQEALA